jgi:hypothetical protein
MFTCNHSATDVLVADYYWQNVSLLLVPSCVTRRFFSWMKCVSLSHRAIGITETDYDNIRRLPPLIRLRKKSFRRHLIKLRRAGQQLPSRIDCQLSRTLIECELTAFFRCFDSLNASPQLFHQRRTSQRIWNSRPATEQEGRLL